MKKPWFKAKRYGIGWTPATWQGWLATAIYVLLVVNAFISLDSQQHSAGDLVMNFVPVVVILTGIFVFVAYFTGEKLRWNWGTTSPKRKTKRRRK